MNFTGQAGWAQVNGRARLNTLEGDPVQLAKDELPISVKVEFDAYSLKNRSFFFDLKILWMTFIKVVKSEGVTH